MTDLKELRKLATAATKGPWRQHGTAVLFDHEDYKHEWIGLRGVVGKDGTDMTTEGGFTRVLKTSDAKFIAAANPATVLELVDQLQGAIEIMKELDYETVQGQYVRAEVINRARSWLLQANRGE